MKFSLILYGSIGTPGRNWTEGLSEDIEDYFSDKNYGDDLKHLIIYILLVEPEFDFFFKPRKRARYRKGKNVFIDHGVKLEVEDSVDYDLKLDFFTYNQYNKREFIKNLKIDILKSIEQISRIKKIQYFDFLLFLEDLKKYFKA